jgi:hypothetical protein
MANTEYSELYLESLHKSIQKADNSSPEVETDTQENRDKRIEKELYIRDHLDAVNGLSIYERLIFVRENLFDTNVRGYRPSEIRKGSIGVFCVVTEGGVPEKLFPDYVKLIDTLDTYMQHMDKSQQPEAAIRLAAIIYGIGIPLHLFSDGNGQTLRLVALSYIHEYVPELRNRYFQVRQSTRDKQPIGLNYVDSISNGIELPENKDFFGSEEIEKFVTYLLGKFEMASSREEVISLYKNYLSTGEASTENVKDRTVKQLFNEAIYMYQVTERDIRKKLNIVPGV